jgi:hypothetical protein
MEQPTQQKCDTRSRMIQHRSTALQFSMLNLKDFLAVDHLVPNQVLGFFEFFREREGSILFQRLTKAFIGADSRNVKMRRLPPTKFLPAAGGHSFRHIIQSITDRIADDDCA